MGCTTENLQCTYDNSQDSIDEVNGRANDPFNPPICFRGVFILTMDPSNLGIKDNTGDLDRIIRGLLIMGGDVESSFNAKALPGHYVELTVFPPDYSTAFEIDRSFVWRTTEKELQKYLSPRVDCFQGQIQHPKPF